MTICLTIKCIKSESKTENPVLLFASDTQESSQFIKRAVTKMRVIHGKQPKRGRKAWNILVASAGEAMVIDEVLDEIEAFLRERIKADEKDLSGRLKSLRKNIGDVAYETYKKYKDRNVTYRDFELLLGAADESVTILYVTCEGKQQVLEQYGIIGIGQVTGGELLASEFLRKDMTQKEAASLAALIVTRIGKIATHVGGEPEIKWCRNRRAWHYKEFRFKRIIEQSKSKWNLMRRIWWRMGEDSTAQEELESIL